MEDIYHFHRYSYFPTVTYSMSFPDPSGRTDRIIASGCRGYASKHAVSLVIDPGTPGFYNQLFLVPKEEWYAASNRRVAVKSLLHHRKLPNGNTSVFSGIASSFTVDDVDRPIRHVFPCTIATSSHKYLRLMVIGVV